MTFDEMEAPSPIFRVHHYEHPAGEKHWQAWFTCPGCNEAHAIGDSWGFNGDWHRPTFTPSYLTWNDPDPRAAEGSKYRTGWRCHSFITDGQIAFCGDCTHALAGQTVPLIPFDLEKI